VIGCGRTYLFDEVNNNGSNFRCAEGVVVAGKLVDLLAHTFIQMLNVLQDGLELVQDHLF